MAKGHGTAIRRNKVSAPLAWLIQSEYWSTNKRNKILDYGAGYGEDAKYLQNKFTAVWSWDPDPKHDCNWNIDGDNLPRFDVVLVTYVLNVVSISQERKIIQAVRGLLKPEGKAFLSVRRDVPLEGTDTQRYVRKRLPSLHKCKGFEIYLLE